MSSQQLRHNRRQTASKSSVSRAELAYLPPVEFEGEEFPDYVEMGLIYARKAAAGELNIAKLAIKACQRFLDMYEQAQEPDNDFYFCHASAVEVCAFAEMIPHVKGSWDPPTLVLQPWQCFLLSAVFGFRWSHNGNRVVREVYIEIARKHGKSFLIAIISLYMAAVDGENGADVFIGAPKTDQAKKVYEPMTKMVEKAQGFADEYGVSHTQRVMTIKATDSTVQMISSKGETEDGHDPYLVVLEEMHAQKAELVKVMKSSQGARPNGMMLMIGSAGRHAFGPGWEEHLRAKKVIEGQLKWPHYFALIYGIDVGDEENWTRPEVVQKANPNWGVSIDEMVGMQEVQKATSSPSLKAEFLRTRLSVWGRNEHALISGEDWTECQDNALSMDEFRGEKCWIGVDLSGRNDMTALGVIFERNLEVVAFCKHYLPDAAPWTQDEEVYPTYYDWADSGHLTLTPGPVAQYGLVEAAIHDLNQKFDIQGIGVDAYQANDLRGRLEEAGLPVAIYPQTAKCLSDPTDDLVSRCQGQLKLLKHDGNPVLAWNAQNVVAGRDTNDNILPKKAVRGSNQKIDGFMTLVFANGLRLGTLEAKDDDKTIVVSSVRSFGGSTDAQ